MNTNNPNIPNPKKDEKKKPESEQERKERINRTIYISAVALVLCVAVIVGITAAMNRSKKNKIETLPDESKGQVVTTDDHGESERETPKEETKTETESETKKENDKEVMEKLPEFVIPVKGTLSAKHDPDTQVFSPTMSDYRVHLGIDIKAEKGAKVCSAAEGVVTKVWKDALMGNCVAIAHDGKACTYYKNLSDTLADGIKEGENVKSGQLIGAVGESAMVEIAEDPHLHFEITVNGLQKDPLDYFDKDVIAKLETDKGYED